MNNFPVQKKYILYVLAMITFVVSGCATPQAHRTFGLNERFPPTRQDAIQIVERYDDFSASNYQIIGNVIIDGKMLSLRIIG